MKVIKKECCKFSDFDVLRYITHIRYNDSKCWLENFHSREISIQNVA